MGNDECVNFPTLGSFCPFLLLSFWNAELLFLLVDLDSAPVDLWALPSDVWFHSYTDCFSRQWQWWGIARFGSISILDSCYRLPAHSWVLWSSNFLFSNRIVVSGSKNRLPVTFTVLGAWVLQVLPLPEFCPMITVRIMVFLAALWWKFHLILFLLSAFCPVSQCVKTPQDEEVITDIIT